MRYSKSLLVTVLLLALAVVPSTRADKSAAMNAPLPPKPPLPSIRSLKLEPPSLTLLDGRDERRVLVIANGSDGQNLDLTAEAVFKADSGIVEIDADGMIHPKSKGETEISITAAGQQIKLPVKVENAEVPPIRFVRDVEPLIGRVGCNAGTCHGSAKGKNGFKLSLRGYDPEFDYQALINDDSGRRFNRVVVEDSLMLLKPTAEVPHEGRQVIKPGSRYYLMLRQWIAEGVKMEDPAKSRADRIDVLPSEIELDLPGRAQTMLVLAHYPDGTTRDITREAVLTSNNSDVAVVKDNVVTGVRRGEAAVLVRYEGSYATKLVTVMGDRTGYAWVDQPDFNYIDERVDAKLRRLKILPSEICSDAEFIRRVSFDLTGQPASSERVRAFLENPAPSRTKREQLVDDLIGTQSFVEYWANKWADLLQCNSESLGKKGVWVFRNWIQQAVAKNMPYDKFVRSLLTAEGSSYMNPEVNYLRVLRDPGRMAEDISQTFLGVRFNCNKCHDHPFEKWTQNQYYQFGAFFAQVGFKRGTFGTEVIRNDTGDQTTVTGEEIIYPRYDGGEVRHPKTDMVVAPKVPYGEAKEAGAGEDRREAFADWLTAKENPFFAKSLANRTWSYFFGRGIIDPVDDIRGSNPPSNPELLDALTEDFVKSGFNIRHLMKVICTSRTYQLSFRRNKWNEDDTLNYSHATPRRLSAEQLMDAVNLATGARPNFSGMPIDMRAVDIPDGTVQGDDFLSLFGRPKRQSACECERSSNVTLSHALNLINGSTIGEAVDAGASRITRLVASESDNHKVVEEIYYSVLNRPPTAKEIAVIDLGEGSKRLEAAQDLAWALINSPAFLFNR